MMAGRVHIIKLNDRRNDHFLPCSSMVEVRIVLSGRLED